MTDTSGEINLQSKQNIIYRVTKMKSSTSAHYKADGLSGAIIGDGDRKRAPFLVLGLAPWYGTIFLFLEQIAPSPAAHARTCCEDFCGCRAGESEIHEIFYAFGPQLNTFMSVGNLA